MVKAMRYRDMERSLLGNGCRWRAGKGDHINWYCPCGQHIAVVTASRIVSPGVVRDTIAKLVCLPEGWLQ
jgi:hypothetical protein